MEFSTKFPSHSRPVTARLEVYDLFVVRSPRSGAIETSCLSYLGIHGALEPCGTLTQHLYGRNALCLQPREAHEVSSAALCWADVERLTEGARILGR